MKPEHKGWKTAARQTRTKWRKILRLAKAGKWDKADALTDAPCPLCARASRLDGDRCSVCPIGFAESPPPLGGLACNTSGSHFEIATDAIHDEDLPALEAEVKWLEDLVAEIEGEGSR